jgi:hypothetical protein
VSARADQVFPSGEVITRFVPVIATAQNNLSSGAQHTEYQPGIASEADQADQAIPSDEIITRLVPL